MDDVCLCYNCIHIGTCRVRFKFCLDCPNFDDGYDGPELYDGDAWYEWLYATFYKESDEATGPPVRETPS